MLKKIIELVHDTKGIIIGKQKEYNVSLKGKKDYVTSVDLAVSKFLHRELKQLYPEYEFMDEEFNNKVTEFSRPTWILDPIDGTTNLVHEYNLSTVSLALLEDGNPILGVVYNPFTEETFSAAKGKGAFLNGQQIKVSDVNNIENALVLLGSNPYERSNPQQVSKMFKMFENLFMKVLEIRLLGSAALELCYIACGRSDVYFEHNLKPWDVAAGIVILKEAGGITTNLDNVEIQPISNQDIVATNGKIHNEILNVLNS